MTLVIFSGGWGAAMEKENKVADTFGNKKKLKNLNNLNLKINKKIASISCFFPQVFVMLVLGRGVKPHAVYLGIYKKFNRDWINNSRK